jgi:ribosomal protein L7Ae-like RNA K-turn-binding protein
VSAPSWLGLVGLGRRAGTVVIGTAGVRAGLQRGEIHLVVVAGDGSPRTDEKVGRLARAKAVPVLVGPEAEVLGRAVGGAAVQAIGLKDPKLAAGLKAKYDAVRVEEE